MAIKNDHKHLSNNYNIGRGFSSEERLFYSYTNQNWGW